MTYVSPYNRADGTHVRGHYRNSPGSSLARSSEGMVAGAIGLLVLAMIGYGLLDGSSRQGSVSASAPIAATSSNTALGSSARIVQVSSHPDRAGADAAAQGLRQRGWNAGVLRSDRYSPLRPGFYVVYIGPYLRTALGQSQAEKVSAKVPGSKVRDVHTK
jgi:hypothetical protein